MSVAVSVITLTHNKLPYTQRCLPGLLQTSFSNWELIIVDNGSTDGTVEWLLHNFQPAGEKHGIKVTVLQNKSNIGCSTSRNQGAGVARGQKLVFVDNDVTLRSKNWLSKLASILDSSQTIGMAGPKLVYPFPPYNIQFAGGAVSPSGRVQFMGRGESREDPRYNYRREVQCFISACFMIKRDIFEKAGGFDEAFNPVEYEDIDLSYRVRSMGYTIIYEPSIEMYHFESVTTTGTPSLPNTYLIIKNGMLFKQRWRHMFERENGPADSEAKWRNIETRRIDEIKDLPLLE